MTVAGHCDERGSEEYNVALGDRRAEAVKRYLVDHHALSADKIDAKGVGESQPVVGCEGVRPRKALIKCLAPNRRVVIDVDIKRVQ